MLIGIRNALAASCLCFAACSPSRYLIVESDPPGATVRLDEEVLGRTPLKAPFEHYGKRRLTVYLEGYQTYSEPLDLSAPWHARFPIDVITEVVLPLGLVHKKLVEIELEPDTRQAEGMSPGPVIERARKIRSTVQRPEPKRIVPKPGAEETEAPQNGDS